MKKMNWKVRLGIGLIILSIIIYLIHFLIFHDLHHIFIYLVGDIAFVPIEVLLVTLIIHQLLTIREKRKMLEKLNMLIGVFFIETGTKLLTYFSDFDPELVRIRNDLIISKDWSVKEFSYICNKLTKYEYGIDIKKINLESLHTFLAEKREFMVRLLENPNLLAHESFTELLWAVFHLTEELASRPDFRKLPAKDLEHLAGDIKRAYGLLVREWLEYMSHLKNNYPYLFSLALRTNPFDQNASPIIQ